MAELVLISALIHLKGQKGCVCMIASIFQTSARTQKKGIAFSHAARNIKQAHRTETCGQAG